MAQVHANMCALLNDSLEAIATLAILFPFRKHLEQELGAVAVSA
jgi:hypothetical protein